MFERFFSQEVYCAGSGWSSSERRGCGGRDNTLRYDTLFALEMDIEYNVPEWGGQDVRIVLEEEEAFTTDGAYFVDGRQTEWYLIK